MKVRIGLLQNTIAFQKY